VCKREREREGERETEREREKMLRAFCTSAWKEAELFLIQAVLNCEKKK